MSDQSAVPPEVNWPYRHRAVVRCTKKVATVRQWDSGEVVSGDVHFNSYIPKDGPAKEMMDQWSNGGDQFDELVMHVDNPERFDNFIPGELYRIDIRPFNP